MKLLLDTMALIWWTREPHLLSAEAYGAIASGENTLLVSAASAYEITNKQRLGKLHVASPLGLTFQQSLERRGFQMLPITVQHAFVAGTVLSHHRDPFDRLIAAQAILEDIPVVTGDVAFGHLGARVLW